MFLLRLLAALAVRCMPLLSLSLHEVTREGEFMIDIWLT